MSKSNFFGPGAKEVLKGTTIHFTSALVKPSLLATAYATAHTSYLTRRGEIDQVEEIDGISAGGMPTRVKCLHVLVAHALAAGRGVNPLGDEALDLLPQWSAFGPCVPREEA